jgi:glycerol 3-phosphatase-1
LVTGWLERLSLPRPEHLVVAEDVEHGKPNPTCYKMGLEKLGMQTRASEILVLEDSPAGIKAGKMAGCSVLAVVTSHTVDQVVNAGADWVVRDLRSVRVVGRGKGGEGAVLEIRDALVKA